MFRNDRLVLMIAACLCVWGCTRVSPTQTREMERIKFLEVKVSKLEEDFRTAAAARDMWKQKAADLEVERTNLTKAGQILMQERDDARAQLAARTTERDTMQGQYDAFRKELRTLLGHAEAAAARTNPQPEVTAAPATTVPGES